MFFIAAFSLGSLDAQTPDYWHTNGSQILNSSNQVVRIAGVNWYGFETSDEVVHGLWAQDYKSILNAIKSNGYNTVRLPFSNQMVESSFAPTNISFNNGMNSDLKGLTSLQIMDKIVTYAGQIGLRIILDNHRSSAGSGTESDLWYTSSYPESAWINDWTNLATRYKGNATVIGVDLRNEPHGSACWGCGGSNDWVLGAERGGNAVLAVNPKLLVFVEGTDCYNGDCDWWGGNLEGAQAHPVTLSVNNQLAYSAHDYGPNLYGQSWFNGSTTYNSLASVWTKFWAYLSINNVAPVWVGEFGTTNNNTDIESSAAGSQGQWFQSLVTFLKSNSGINWTYWALNGEDSYALLDSNYDPAPANPLKQQLLASIQSPLGGGTGGNTPPAAPTALSATAASSSQINLTWIASTTSGVTYNVYESTSSGFASSSTTRIANNVSQTSFQHQGLTASTTYYYLLTSVAGGLESTPSNQASATTQSGGGSGGSSCQVTYSVPNDWGSGFTANLSIANTGTSAINGWSLSWTWPGNQQFTQAWNANSSQSGATATLTNASWNATISPGATVTGIGFNANYSGTNSAPTIFYVNGARCNGSGSGTPAPAAPTNLSAAGASSSQINLSWTASTTAGVTYNLYASLSSGFTPSASNRIATGVTSTQFINTGLNPSTNYFYLVTAVNGSTESSASNQAAATTLAATVNPPAVPSSLSATAVSSSQINLSWTVSSTSRVTYNVYANTSPNWSSVNRIATNLSGASFQNTGLSASTTYYYVVTAVNSAGESPFSNQSSATTQPTSSSSVACHVSYVDQNDWGNGFTGAISITNTANSPINGWILTWTWPGNQQLSGGWNAAGSQTGQQITFGSLNYNGSISPGATISGIGFNANYSGLNTAPTAFYLNGTLCQ